MLRPRQSVTQLGARFLTLMNEILLWSTRTSCCMRLTSLLQLRGGPAPVTFHVESSTTRSVHSSYLHYTSARTRRNPQGYVRRMQQGMMPLTRLSRWVLLGALGGIWGALERRSWNAPLEEWSRWTRLRRREFCCERRVRYDAPPKGLAPSAANESKREQT